MTLTFDHVIILVHDLATARAEYRELGFNVIDGGQHADGQTHNALMVFQDGSYLELLAPTDAERLNPANPHYQTSFLRLFQQGEGFGGYALQSDALEAEVGRMQARGLSAELRPSGGRVRPDGQQIQWRTAALGNTMTPFFIQDITPRQLRVPNDSQTITHPNGVTGVSEIVINAANLDDTIGRYQMLTGLQNLISFPVGETQIRLTTAATDAKRDETLYQVTLHTQCQVQGKSLPDGGLIHFSSP